MESTRRQVLTGDMLDESEIVDTGIPLEDEIEGMGVPQVEPEASEDDFVAVDETAEGESGEQFAQRIRQRAEQKSETAYKLLPQFTYEYHDGEDFKNEINEWYDYRADRLFVLKDCKKQFGKSWKAEGKVSTLWFESSEKAQKKFVKRLLVDVKKEDGKRDYSAIQCLAYIAEGCYGEVCDVSHHVGMIKTNCRLLWQENVLEVIYEEFRRQVDQSCPSNPTDSVNMSEQDETKLSLLLNIMYLMIESLGHDTQFSQDLNELNPKLLDYLIEIIGRLRWTFSGKLPTKHILLLLWKSMLCLFGGAEMITKVKSYRRRQYGLPEENNEKITSSPLDYHAFREDVTSRYPSYIPPPSQLPKFLENSESISHYIEVPRPAHAQQSNSSLPPPAVHIATPAPSPPSSPAIASGQKVKKSVFMTNQSFPFIYPTDGSVPESIIEAGELFASRVRTTPAMVQLWDERDKFMKYERGWTSINDDKTDQAPYQSSEQEVLKRIDEFYGQSYTRFYSFINVLLKIMLKCTTFAHGSEVEPEVLRINEINLQSISAIFLLMLRWFKVSHILKFEYFATLLFDSRYYLLVYKFLYSCNVLERALFIPDVPHLSFFHLCKELSDHAKDDYGETSSVENMTTMSPSEARFSDKIDTYSSRYLFSVIGLLRVLRKIIKKKPQRIIIVAELPSETLRKALTIYQRDLWRVVLDIFKEQVPYNGRKWKYNNMDLVSAIYLHCKAKLRDDWLSGIDVSSEVDDAYAQEAATRALTMFYNNHMYEEVEESGKSETTDFFVQELSALSLGSRVS